MLVVRILRSALHCSRHEPCISILQRLQAPTQYVGLHSSSVPAAKVFIDRENQFAHDVLQQSLKPYQIFRMDEVEKMPEAEKLPVQVLNPSGSPEAMSADEVFRNFSVLVAYCKSANVCISDERFRSYVKFFCAASHTLSDDQLTASLRQLTLLPAEESTRAPNYMELWNQLDIECCRRIQAWSTDSLLLVCDVWYTLNLARISDFVCEALIKLGRKVRKMRPEQMVQTMFLCNVVRRPMHEMFDFEHNLASCMNEMSLQELGVMAMGFFKTQTAIHNPELLDHLCQRLTAELDTVEDITLVAILKILRYSCKLPHVELIKRLLDKLDGQVERISLLGCMHVALLGSDLQCCHEAVIEHVLQRFDKDVAHTRLKDLERICLIMGIFNFRSESGIEGQLCAKILDALRSRPNEIVRHPRCFIMCLHYLTLSDHHDAEMINSALDMRFLRHAYGKHLAMGREVFCLDSFVRINLKDSYAGNQLPDKSRATMGKLLTHYIPVRSPKFKLNATDRILMEIKETADVIFRGRANFKHILPHFERPDVVICYDKSQRKALPLSTECAEDYSGVILTRKELLGNVEAPSLDTVAIVVAGWNNVVREKNRFTGAFDLKLEQLSLLGHKYIVIYWHEWRSLETYMDRQNFVKRKLAAAHIL